MSDLLDLAARIEAATEGSRELDAETADTTDSVVPCACTGACNPDSLNYLGGCPSVRAYTTSLDAALTLVPEGWSFSVGDLRGYDPPMWRCHLRDHRPQSLTAAGHSHIWKEGNTIAGPALAICAAALKARASTDLAETDGLSDT